jgi:hypothetical protein
MNNVRAILSLLLSFLAVHFAIRLFPHQKGKVGLIQQAGLVGVFAFCFILAVFVREFATSWGMYGVMLSTKTILFGIPPLVIFLVCWRCVDLPQAVSWILAAIVSVSFWIGYLLVWPAARRMIRVGLDAML